jgi:hypothetical protein
MSKRLEIANHYRAFMNIKSLDENDQLIIDWAETLIDHLIPTPKEIYMTFPTEKGKPVYMREGLNYDQNIERNIGAIEGINFIISKLK